MNETVSAEKPWREVGVLGITQTQNIKLTRTSANILFVGHKACHVSKDDCVEHEVIYLQTEDKITATTISERPWQPIWRKVSAKNVLNGNNLVVGQDEVYHEVLLMIQGEMKKVWMSEKILSKFTWES